MSKRMADFPIDSFNTLLEILNRYGFTLINPSSNEISGFSEDRITFHDKEEAIAFLKEGRGGIQLWLNDAEDLFISNVGGEIRLYFDGYTEDETDDILSYLTSQNLIFYISCDY